MTLLLHPLGIVTHIVNLTLPADLNRIIFYNTQRFCNIQLLLVLSLIQPIYKLLFYIYIYNAYIVKYVGRGEKNRSCSYSKSHSALGCSKHPCFQATPLSCNYCSLKYKQIVLTNQYYYIVRKQKI